MLTKSSFVFLLVFYLSQTNGQSEYCYAKDKTPYLNFGRFTGYENARALSTETPKNCTNCTPIYLWSLVRPDILSLYDQDDESSLSILRERILENYAEKRSKLCESDFLNLKKRVPPQPAFNDGQQPFTVENWIRNLNNTFGNNSDPQNLFNMASGKKSFEIQSPKTQPAKDTAIKLARILYKMGSLNEANDLFVENDVLLHLEEHCPAYNWNNQNLMKNFQTFLKSNILKTSLQEISARLGYEQNKSLNFYDLLPMYTSCGYDHAFKSKTQPFCAAFLPKHLKLMEYVYDLILYYNLGFGNENNEKMGCMIIQTMLKNMTNAAKNKNNSIRASFYTTYFSTLMSALLKLDVFHSKNFPSSDDEEVWLQPREWKSSFYIPFSANLVAVLYKCPEDDVGKYVAFFYNEKPLHICKDNLCSLEYLKTKFSDVFLPDQCGTKFCHPAR